MAEKMAEKEAQNGHKAVYRELKSKRLGKDFWLSLHEREDGVRTSKFRKVKRKNPKTGEYAEVRIWNAAEAAKLAEALNEIIPELELVEKRNGWIPGRDARQEVKADA